MQMAMWERQAAQSLRYKPPSFSSSLLDAIYRSIDDQPQTTNHQRRTNVEEDIESLRRAIMIEKWINNSASSETETESPVSRTESPVSRTRTSPKSSSLLHLQNRKIFIKTKTKAQKIYSELKKVKEPISPGGKITSFLNSIFTSRNIKSTNGGGGTQGLEDWTSMRKSRSMKDTTKAMCSSRSCLSKNASSGGSKSKRTVRFCPVSVVLDQDMKPSAPSFITKKNVDDKNLRKFGVRDCYESEYDLDNMSCGSSDLFELEELPVYGTTRIGINRAIASGVVI